MHEIRELTNHLTGAARAQFVLADRAATGQAAVLGRPAWSTSVMLPATDFLEPVGRGAAAAEQLWLSRAYPGAIVDVPADDGWEEFRTLGRLGVAIALLRGPEYGRLLDAARAAQEAGLVPVLQLAEPLRLEQLAGLWFDLLTAGAEETACFVVVQTTSGTGTRAVGGSGPDLCELPAAGSHPLTGLPVAV